MTDQFTEICYEKNFLNEVIVRVDFLSPLSDLSTTFPSALSECISRNFPIPEPKDVVKRSVKIGPQVVESSEERSKEWRFFGKDRLKVLTISQDCVIAQYLVYHTYESLKDEFLQISNLIASLFPAAQSSRLGLRYINEIEIPNSSHPTDWSEYLDDKLINLFKFPPEPERESVSRVFHNIELNFDSYNLRFLFGMHNPDYPARIRRKIFVLDFDSYGRYVTDLKEIEALLDTFHDTIQRYFELSITDKIRSILNAK